MYKSASNKHAFLTRAANHSDRISRTGDTPVTVPWLPDAVSLQKHVRRKRDQIERLRHELATAEAQLAATGSHALRGRIGDLEKTLRDAVADMTSVAERTERLTDLTDDELFFEICRENLTKDVFLALMAKVFERLDEIRKRGGTRFVTLEREYEQLKAAVIQAQERRKAIVDRPGARTRRRFLVAQDPEVREIDRLLDKARARLHAIKPALKGERERTKATVFRTLAEQEMPDHVLVALKDAVHASLREAGEQDSARPKG